MTYTKQTRPTSTFTKDARPTDSFTKSARPHYGAMADFAQADFAIVDTTDGYTKIARPE